ncbi:MAG: AAA family ATPase [Steroidobacteraceae bacterium]|nr:AAA family ATPase [Steroidobacteraceae bacterium]
MAAALDDLGLDADLERVPIEDDAADLPRFVRRPIDWRALADRTPPERDWAVSHWLGMGYVTLLAGAGGVGKTLVAQTLATCLAIGRGYIDYAPRPRRVLMLAGEDDHDELWRRQVAICQWLGVGLDAVADALIIESYVDRDMTLADVAYGQLVRTPFLAELREQIGDYRADVVMLDSVARVFGGNENDRHHVTQFLTWLAAACEPTHAGLLLLAHPSRAAGSEWSGSTAWEASVRARLYLGRTLPDQEPDEDEPPDETVRYLARRKANYTDRDYRRLTYRDGVLVPELDAQRRPVSRPTGEAAIDVVVRAVRRLAEIGIHACASPNSPRYLPRLAVQYDYAEGMSPRDLAHAMRNAQKSGRLITTTVGRAANRSPVMGLAEPATDEVH